MTSKNFLLSRKDELVIQELKDEILIYDLKTNKAYCLNETSALVWQMCDGNKSVSEISKQISIKLKQTVSEDFVWFAIDQLKKDNLLDNSQDLEINFNGLSRREVIRKVGFASMVVLPVVASLVAPTAAAAQSGGCNIACGPNGNTTPCSQSLACSPACDPLSNQCLPAAGTCVALNQRFCSPALSGVGENNCCAGLICDLIGRCFACSAGGSTIYECGPGTSRPQPCTASAYFGQDWRCCSGIANAASTAPGRWECYCL